MKRIVDLSRATSGNDVVSVNTVNHGLLVIQADGQELGRLTVEHLWLEGQDKHVHLLKLSFGDVIVYLIRPEDRQLIERIPVELSPIVDITLFVPITLESTSLGLTITAEITEIFALDEEYLNILFQVEVAKNHGNS